MAARLMLLPGLICDSRMFAAQTARFPDAVVIDGFGTLDRIEAMAHQALAAAPDRISLLGHSMGARVALEMYRLDPARIERLALVSTGVHGVKSSEPEKRQTLIDLGRAEGAAALVDCWLPPMVAPARIADTALMEPLREMCIAAGVDAFVAQVHALLGRPEVESLLPQITCPTLVAVGSADAWSPPAQHATMAALIPAARLCVIEGSGHMLPAEAPQDLNDAIADWLSITV